MESEIQTLYTRKRNILTCNACGETFDMYSSKILEQVVAHTDSHKPNEISTIS